MISHWETLETLAKVLQVESPGPRPKLREEW
jgi:hypothetical protein